MRFHVLKGLGHEVAGLNARPADVAQREMTFPQRVIRKLVGPLDLAKLNRRIDDEMRRSAYDILWLDRPLTISPATFRAVKRLQPNCQIVGYSLDDMNARHNQSRRFLRTLPLYDYFFTTKTYGVPELKALGCPRVEFTGNAFDPAVHRPIELTDQDRKMYGCDVGFIGTFEEDRAAQMNYLAHRGVEVQIVGDFWNRMQNPHLKINLRSNALYGDAYAKTICATTINLCFLRKLNRDLQTTRSVEIPACGGFMLAERTDEHLALFEEGVEAEFFSSKEELLSKVRYFLGHDLERKRIAAAGRQRCLRSGYSYHERLKEILILVGKSEPPQPRDICQSGCN